MNHDHIFREPEKEKELDTTLVQQEMSSCNEEQPNTEKIDPQIEKHRTRIAEIVGIQKLRRECFEQCSRLFHEFAGIFAVKIAELQLQRDNKLLEQKTIEKDICTALVEQKEITRQLDASGIHRIISKLTGTRTESLQRIEELKQTISSCEKNRNKIEEEVAGIRTEIKALRKIRHEWFRFSDDVNCNQVDLDDVIRRFNEVQYAIVSSQVPSDFRERHDALISAVTHGLGGLIDAEDKQNLAS